MLSLKDIQSYRLGSKVTLSQAQCDFTCKLALLIQKGQELGYAVKIACYLRTIKEEQAQIDAGKTALKDPAHSKHVQGLAIDLALFQNGILTENPKDYLQLGMYWEAIGGRWGGRFHPLDANNIGFDPDHFETPFICC